MSSDVIDRLEDSFDTSSLGSKVSDELVSILRGGPDAKKDWEELAFGDLVEIIDGDRGKNYPTQGDFAESGHCLFLNAKNVLIGNFSFAEKMFISSEKDEALRKGKLRRGDYVLTTRGTVGNFARYSEEIPYDHVRINSGMVILRPNQSVLDNKFLQYLLGSFTFSQNVFNFVSGSAQPQLPIRDMRRMRFNIPPLHIQKQIADLLSVFDEKIELLRTQNKTLEAIAHVIYMKSKHEGPACVSVRLGDIGKIVGGGTPSTEVPEYWDGNIAWLTPKDLSDNEFVVVNKGDRSISEKGLRESSARLLPKNTVLFTSRAPIGYVAIAGCEMATNQGFKSVICDDLKADHRYVYFVLKRSKSHIERIASGSTFLEVSGTTFSDFKIEMPVMDVQKKIGECLEKAIVNANSIQNCALLKNYLQKKIFR